MSSGRFPSGAELRALAAQARIHDAVGAAAARLRELAAQVAAIPPPAPDEGPDVAAIAADVAATADALQAAVAASH